MCDCQHGCVGDPVIRNYLYQPRIELRLRTRFDGREGVHPPTPSNVRLRRGHWRRLNRFVNYFEQVLLQERGVRLKWVGQIGSSYVCKPGMHPIGRALDTTAYSFGNGNKVDFNIAWRPGRPVERRRLYLAWLAAARMHTAYVIGAYWDASHGNHVHLDSQEVRSDGSTPPLQRGWRTDTIIVQMACNFLNGAGLAIDGQFGSQTTTAYNNLASRMNMRCLSPFNNAWHMIAFLDNVVHTAVKNRQAGYRKGTC